MSTIVCPVCGTPLKTREENDTIIWECPKQKEHDMWIADKLINEEK